MFRIIEVIIIKRNNIEEFSPFDWQFTVRSLILIKSLGKTKFCHFKAITVCYKNYFSYAVDVVVQTFYTFILFSMCAVSSCSLAIQHPVGLIVD